MDNFQIDVTSYGREHFELALRLAAREGTFDVRYYGLVDGSKLILFMYDPPPCVSLEIRQLPTKMKLADVIEFAWSWLHSKECDYGKPPYKGGEALKGFRVYTDERGFVDGMWQAFAAIEPKWGSQCTATQTR